MTPLDAALSLLDRKPYDLMSAKVRALIRGYHDRWHDEAYLPIAVEQFVTADLVNPDTQSKSKTFRLGGKVDMVAMYHDKRICVDHKTATPTIHDPDADYWRQSQVESQWSHYLLIAWLNGEKFDGSMINVLRKPSISPKKLTKADRAYVLSNRKYCDHKISDETLEHLQHEERENFELYEARLYHDCTEVRPEWYYQRRMIWRMDHEILEYAQEVWQHGQNMRNVRKRRAVRNSGACMLYGSPCRFLGICSGHDTPDSDRWQRKASIHEELPEYDPAKDGDLLTNSRIRTFQTCEMKHKYDYEIGIERYDAEEKEALVFGTLWHEVLAAYYTSLMKGESNGDDATGDSVSEVEHASGPAGSEADSGGSYW